MSEAVTRPQGGIMGAFLKDEKQRYVAYKASSTQFPEPARALGTYRGKPRPFCLPLELAQFNLFDGIRDEVQAYFREYEIKWHDGRNRMPSNHLCDSQVCYVNLLYPFSRFPDALASLLRPVFPQIRRMLPLEREGQFVSHEWIGAENYLGEKMPRHGKRTRGANFTSADAAVSFESLNGSKQIVLIEWKNTETYATKDFKIAESGTDRSEIYRHLYNRVDFPLNKDLLGRFDHLFFEPFYQLMRQQLLANEMEKAAELGA
jgi:Restriction Endonuclease associating with ARP